MATFKTMAALDEVAAAAPESVAVAVALDDGGALDEAVALAVEAAEEVEDVASAALRFPHVTDRHACWPSRSLGWAATQSVRHCWHTRDGKVCANEEMLGLEPSVQTHEYCSVSYSPRRHMLETVGRTHGEGADRIP